MPHSRQFASATGVITGAVRSFFEAATVLLIFISGLPSWTQQGGDKALALRRNVVRVFAGADNAENGFGFIVSQQDRNLYIVTAYHVVEGLDTPDKTPSVIHVIFYTDPSTPYKAELLAHTTRDHDLALLRVEAPPGFTWERQCVAGPEDAKRGTPVWFIGRDATWYVPALNGAISSERPTADWWLNADMPGVSPGSSGAPLVTNTGIIALVKGGAANETRVLSIEFIKTAVQDWGYRWDLVNPSKIGSIATAAQPTEALTVSPAENIEIKCDPACATDANFALSVSYPAATILSKHFRMAQLGVLLPKDTALKSWTLTSDGNAPIESGTGVPDYSSGDVFVLLPERGNYPIDFNLVRRLSGDVGVKVTSYNVFAFCLGESRASGGSIQPITFSGFKGARSFPAGTIFFAFVVDQVEEAGHQTGCTQPPGLRVVHHTIVNQTALDALVVVH